MITPNANRLTIVTEDAVTFSVLLASPLLRGLAMVIDMIIINFVIFLLYLLMLLLILPSKSIGLTIMIEDMIAPIFIISFFLLTFAYYIFQEYFFGGQTIGKRVMKIRVIDENIQRLTLTQIILRNLFRVLDMLPSMYALAGITALLSPKFQRLGDIAAATIVIRNRSYESPDIPSHIHNKYNSFRRYPHLEAQLRKNTLPEERQLALEAVLRRDKLDPDARIQLYKKMSAHFRQKARFPADIQNELSDEQYLRNCTDTLYRR